MLLLELQKNKDTVKCATLGKEVPVHRQEQLTETITIRLLKNALVFVFLKIGGARTPLAPLTGLSSARLMAALKID